MIGQQKKKDRPVFFDSESWRQAAVDVYVATVFAPKGWPLEKAQSVIHLLRMGRTPDEIAGRSYVSVDAVERIKRLIRYRTVDELIRSNSGTAAREAALIAGMFALAVAIMFGIGIDYGLIHMRGGLR